MRVLHVLHNSLPFICGYSIRSKYVAENQRASGLAVAAVTSAQHPNIESAFDEIGGVTYTRTKMKHAVRLFPVPREVSQMLALQENVSRVIGVFKPDVVHAHSPVLVGLPSLRAARAAKIPFVYEVRDLWENASVDRGRFSAHSIQYVSARHLESYVLRQADRVITICEQLRKELAPRANGSHRVHVVPNGVDSHGLSPRDMETDVRRRYDLGSGPLIMYLGTFQPYEGLELLVRSFGIVRNSIPSARLVIVGESPIRAYSGQQKSGLEDSLQRAVASAELESAVVFTGRVPHDQVRDLYTSADLVVYPRLFTRTTALTTPLKPLEAMAMAKAVLVSDVPAMQELVQHGVTGWSFPAGDAAALASACVTLLRDAPLRTDLGAAARAWVIKERDWRTVTAMYLPLYAELTGAGVSTSSSLPAV